MCSRGGKYPTSPGWLCLCKRILVSTHFCNLLVWRHSHLNLLTPPLLIDGRRLEGLVCDELRAGLNSLVILGSWTIWKLRNDYLFNGASPRVATALALAKDEAQLWGSAGAKGLSLLTITSFGWPRVACWFGLVRFTSLSRV
jgi:hypothetical protein